MTAKWKIIDLDITDRGSADSVEVLSLNLEVSDSNGHGTGAAQLEFLYVPKNPVYYSDSSVLRTVLQDSAFDLWVESDSDSRVWMERTEWLVKERVALAERDREPLDSNKISRLIVLNDSAEVVNPLGL